MWTYGFAPILSNYETCTFIPVPVCNDGPMRSLPCLKNEQLNVLNQVAGMYKMYKTVGEHTSDKVSHATTHPLFKQMGTKFSETGDKASLEAL